MKNLFIFLFLVFQIQALQAQKTLEKNKLFKLPKGVNAKDYEPGIVVVKFKAGADFSAKTFSLKQLKPLKTASILALNQKFPGNANQSKTLARGKIDVGLNRIYEVKVSRTDDIEDVINELLQNPEVEYAEPHYIHRIRYIPNDPRFLTDQQPYLNQVKAPQAWDLIRNGSKVIIAIVDNGSEVTHQDLAANIQFNTAEIANNGKDDDNNGKVDDYNGWDFSGPSGNTEDNNPNVTGPNNDHGVHVSGIASSVTDNGIGVSSVAFNSAKLLIVKTGPDNDATEINRGYEGIKYAVDRGAQIINCSWGSTGVSNFGRDVVNDAISKGCLIVAAAGNSGTSTPDYPAAYPGVLAVANADNADVVSPSSNYGNYVSISAPGSGILSTTFNNTYDFSSGTSMSSPMVASAAALVKSYFSQLNMQQVGELLRITADNIDNKNPALAGKIGKGRLNVLRALTETPPSVRIQKIIEEEHKSANVLSPDTLYLYFDIKNFLYQATNLTLTLSTVTPNVSVLISQINTGSLAPGATKQVGPFKVLVSPQTPINTTVDFRLDYTANGNTYQDFEGFSVVVARDYVTVRNNSVSTTLTSTGRIGYSTSDQDVGEGFSYKGSQLLYEAALMIGTSSTKVSNNARSTDEESDEHFVKTARARELVNNTDSIKAEAGFDDSANPNRLNLSIKQQMVAYKAAPNDKYVITEYEVFNTTNFALNNVYIGLFTDFDIGNPANNVTQFNTSSRIGYVFNKLQPASYAAVKLLSDAVAPLYYPMSFNLPGDLLSDDNFTIAEKWQTLSSGVKDVGLGMSNASGLDVSFVSGNGPYTIPANTSVKVAFALIGGDNLPDIEASAAAAQQKYNIISARPPQGEITGIDLQTNSLLTAENTISTLRFSLPEEGDVSLELYNILGQKVRTLITRQPYGSGNHFLTYDFSGGYLSEVANGMYFYRLTHNFQSVTKKIIISR